jgi:hypothetical protein
MLSFYLFHHFFLPLL